MVNTAANLAEKKRLVSIILFTIVHGRKLRLCDAESVRSVYENVYGGDV